MYNFIKYEESILNSLSDLNIDAVRWNNVSYPDIFVYYNNIYSWIEAKMDKHCNMANPRVFFNGTKWDTTYKTPVAILAVNYLNTCELAKEFIEDIKEYTKKSTIKLPTTKSRFKR